MIEVVSFCITLANGGVSCIVLDTMEHCTTAAQWTPASVIEAECQPMQMRAGTEYAPGYSPLPPLKS